MKPIFSKEDIDERLRKIGKQISEDYKGKELLLVGILNGAAIFLCDLIKHITIPVEMDFLGVQSYQGITSDNIRITKDLKINPCNKHVIIVEDIIDTGKTMDWIIKYFKSKNTKSVDLCLLMKKETDRRKKEYDCRYLAFTCPDIWIVGYGFDYNEKYRNLPYIGQLIMK